MSSRKGQAHEDVRESRSSAQLHRNHVRSSAYLRAAGKRKVQLADMFARHKAMTKSLVQSSFLARNLLYTRDNRSCGFSPTYGQNHPTELQTHIAFPTTSPALIAMANPDGNAAAKGKQPDEHNGEDQQLVSGKTFVRDIQKDSDDFSLAYRWTQL